MNSLIRFVCKEYGPDQNPAGDPRRTDAKGALCLMKTAKASYVKLLLCFLLSLVLLVAVSAASAEVKPWSTMKNFKVKTLDGTVFELDKVLQEKELVVIDLWYIDCGFCPAASAALQLVQEEYQDRVAFLSVNPFDNAKAIQNYTEARGFTIPCARFGSGAKWTQWYPCYLIIDRDKTVLASLVGGCESLPSARKMLDELLAVTPEQKAEYKEANMDWDFYTYSEASTPEEKRAQAFINAAYYAYNLNHDMSLEVTGESVSRIVIDTDYEALRRIELTGEFYVIPSQAPFTVRVKTEKGFKPAKAFMTTAHFDSAGAWAFNRNWSGLGSDIPFKDAKKEKNDYLFELTATDRDMAYYFFESGYAADLTKDSLVGVHVFPTLKQAEEYLNSCSEKFGYSFTWHVE